VKQQGYSMDNVCLEAPAFVALTEKGAALARTLQPHIPNAELHGLVGRVAEADGHFDQAKAWIAGLFDQGRPIIGICAAGILIRAIAPLLVDKRAEPPVVAISEDGRSIVPLLGGHHGANAWAVLLAEKIQGFAALTTAGECRFGVALDAPPKGWRLSEASKPQAKAFMAALLAGDSVALHRDEISWPVDWLQKAGLPWSEPSPETREVSHSIYCTIAKAPTEEDKSLVYHPTVVAVGIGCERGASAADIKSLLFASLEEAGIALEAVAVLVSIDVKMDEIGLHQLAQELGLPVRFYPAKRLEQERPRLQTPSEIVFQEVGCHGVAEGAALAAVGEAGWLTQAKRKSKNVTCAIAQAPLPLAPGTIGQARGHLAVIGTGPGCRDWRTPECESFAVRADVLVGYHLYLDLLGPAVAGKPREAFELGEETARVERALDLAAQGKRVALVCSGDPGIYAMASLVFERLEFGANPNWQKIDLHVSPGISALQAASARIGAPLGHDFCTISLSDLMTPWAAIEKRIETAAQGDFVIAFYNPVSRKRRTQLAKAQEILLKHRPATSPVILARNLGRSGEEIRVVSLESLKIEDVDMLTLVLVGSSESRALTMGNGQHYVYTPRGYKGKQERAGRMGEQAE